MINKKELNTLLNRYMEGETTLKEEQQLVAYFKSHPNVSVSLQPIRQLILGLEAIRKPLQQEEIQSTYLLAAGESNSKEDRPLPICSAIK